MKRILATVLSILMVVGCLTGCGGKTQTPAQSGPAQSEPAASAAQPQAGESAGTIGTPENPVEVKIVVKDVFPNEQDVIDLCAAVSEKMAAHGQYIKLTFVEPPASGYASAMPLAVMNGEVDADIIYFQGGDKAVADQGLLTDLTSYIAGSTYVKALMDESNVEKMANYPYLLWLAPPRTFTPVIRSDVAAQMTSYSALTANPSVENYYNFFKELKTSGYEYAMSFYGDTARLDTIFNHAFGVTGTVVQENGKWIFSKASQAEKEKLAFYAKLYADGLIDPNYLTETWDVVEQKFYEGNVGIISGTAGSVIQIYDNKIQSVYGANAALTVLPPAAGVSQSYTSVDVTKESRGMAINVDSKNKDAAWAVLEFMASPEGRILDKVGIEGKHYTIENNQIVFTDQFTSWWARFWDTTRNFAPENPSLAAPVLTDAASSSLELVNQYMQMDKNLLIPEEMTPQWDAMNNLYNEYSADIIRGVKSVDAFDEFVAAWNAAGGDQFAPILSEMFG